jgi:hypothetical protein
MSIRPRNTEIERDAKLLVLLRRQMARGKWHFKGKHLCEKLNCTLEELLAAFDRLGRTGHLSPVAPPPPKYDESGGPN